MPADRAVRLRADVTIGQLLEEYAPSMFAWMQDPAVSANIGLTTTPTLEKTRAWIGNALIDSTMRPYAVLWQGRHVGNVILDQIDWHLDTARLSIYIGSAEARGCGVGAAGMYRALADGFMRQGLHKVWLTVHAENAAAIRTYVKLGFQVEGVLRDGFLLSGRRVQALYMGILRHEFEALAVEFV
jgi:RimJ/RimL family protein N-acetyltransferase